MDLILWRHAQAVERGEDGGDDEARELTAKGRKQAKRVAAWLRKRLPDDYVVLASPATRARQTAASLSDAFETTKRIATSAGGKALLTAARWPKGQGTVVLVGHQPAMGEALGLALTGKAEEWPIRKGGLWWLRVEKGEPRPVVVAVIDPRLV